MRFSAPAHYLVLSCSIFGVFSHPSRNNAASVPQNIRRSNPDPYKNVARSTIAYNNNHSSKTAGAKALKTHSHSILPMETKRPVHDYVKLDADHDGDDEDDDDDDDDDKNNHNAEGSPKHQPSSSSPSIPKFHSNNLAPSALPTLPPSNTTDSNTTTSGSGGADGGSEYKGLKRGLAYNNGSPSLDVFDGIGGLLNGGWAYNWFSDPGKNFPSKGGDWGLDYAPMLWGLKETHVSVWRTNADKAIAKNQARGKTTYLLGFNEPDIPDQAGMGVDETIKAWNQYIQPYANSPAIKLGAPAVSNAKGTDAKPQGLNWLKNFLEGCKRCQVDFVNVHWYGCRDGCTVEKDISSFRSHIQSSITAAQGRPIWITEFATHADEAAFMRDVLPWLDGLREVERYSWFMVMDGILTDNGKVGALGRVYAGVE